MDSVGEDREKSKGDTEVETYEQLFGYEQTLIDERGLEENCRNRQYKFACFTLNLFIWISSLTLAPDEKRPKDKRENGIEKAKLKNILKFQNPLECSGDKRSERMGRMNRILRMLWLFHVFSITAHLVAIALYHLERDRLKLNMKPSIRGNATGSDLCVLESDRFSMEDNWVELKKSFDYMTSVLKLFGDPYINLLGTMTISLGVPASFAMNYFLLGSAYMHFWRVRADQFCFILDPLGERRRMRLAVVEIIKDLLGASKNFAHFFRLELLQADQALNDECSSTPELSLKPSLPIIGSNNIRRRVTKLSLVKQFCELMRKNSIKDKGLGQRDKRKGRRSFAVAKPEQCSQEIELKSHDENLNDFGVSSINSNHIIMAEMMSRYQLAFLRRDTAADHIRPANMSPSWHKRFLFVWGSVVLPFTIGGWFQYGGVVAGISSAELYKRADYRLQLLRCQQYGPNSIPSGEDCYITPNEKLSPLDLAAYQSYVDGTSTKSILGLAWTVEVKYWMTPSITYVVVVGFILCMQICFWINFYLEAYIEATGGRLIWLEQIENQLQFCNDLMSRYSCTFGRNKTRQPSKEVEGALAQAIVVCYLNYELFRRQHTKFRLSFSFFVNQAIMLGLCMWAIGYLVGTYIGTREFIMVLFLAVYLPIIVNIHLFNAARISAKLRNIMKLVMKLISNGALNSMENSFIIEIWRRQILNDDEIDLQFSLRAYIFGNISYETIMTFNGYVGGVLLLFYKNKLAG